MPRPSRSLTVFLLWLAIALLPIRGWAAAVMPAAGTGAMPVAAQADHSEPHDAALPCHDAHDEPTGASGHTCSLCDVCHSAVVAMTGPAPALPVLPAARPRSGPAPGIERAVQSGPERPPRNLRA